MRTLPLLLVISTTLFHLAYGSVSTDSNGNTVIEGDGVAVGKGSKVVLPNGETVYGSDDSKDDGRGSSDDSAKGGDTVSSGQYSEPNDDGVVKSPAVFASPCNAQKIDVTLDGGYLTSIYPNGKIQPAGGGQYMNFIMGGCSAKTVPTVEGKSMRDRCEPSWLNFQFEEGFVKVYLPSGVFTTSGTRFIAKADCKGNQSIPVCSGGKCMTIGLEIGAVEEESPVETDEETEITPDDSNNESDTTSINGNDDRSDSGSINGNSDFAKPTTPEDEEIFPPFLIYVMGGVLAMAIFTSILNCVLKKRLRNAEEANVEEGVTQSSIPAVL